MAQVMGLPGEDELEFSRIERRRQLANMLAGDAMSPIQNMGTGAYASPISPFQGLQKILAGYLAGTGMRDADKAQRNVIEGRSRKIDSAFNFLEQLRKPETGALTQQGQAYEPSPITRNPVQGIAPLTRQEMDDVTGADYAGLRKPVPPVDLPGVFDLGPNVAKTMGIPLREATLEDVGGVIRAPEVGVTTSQGGADAGGAPRVAAPETPDAYMAKVRIAARKAGLSTQVFLDAAPDVKATYERLMAEDKDKREFLTKADLEGIKQQHAIALEAIQAGRVKNVQALEDGRVILIDGQGKQVGVIQGPEKFRTIESGAGVDAKGNPQTVQKQISFIAGKPTAIDIPGVAPQSRAPLVQNTVSNKGESAYTQKFATGVAEQDLALRDAAMKAPEAAERSIRIMQVLRQNPITGAGANFILGVAKALKQAGINLGDNEIAATEQLISDLANITLDSIKTSGLGANQGFTDKDRVFLQEAKAGRITFDAATLDRLARLNYKAQAATAQKWNVRLKSMPESALGSIGITRDPINVPPMDVGKSASPNVRPRAYNKQTKEWMEWDGETWQKVPK